MTGQGRYGTLAPDVFPLGPMQPPDQGFAVRLEDYPSPEVTEQCLVDGQGALMHVLPLSTKYGAPMRQFVVPGAVNGVGSRVQVASDNWFGKLLRAILEIIIATPQGLLVAWCLNRSH